MKKFVLTMVLVSVGSFGLTHALTDPSIKEQNLGIDLYYESASLEYLPPSWFQPVSLDAAPEDIEHWLLDVLPYEEDRYANMYMVIPQLGLVTPVIDIPWGSLDYQRMVGGKDIAINNYLKGGVIEYVGSVSPGHRGKRVDFGHSNYYKSDNGRYKSIFSNLMALDAGDQVRYYVKQPSGKYKLFKYEVTKSYPTNPNNVAALARDGNGADALIFGCYHGLDGRWMVEATLIGPALDGPEDARYGALSTTWKDKVKASVAKIWRMPWYIKSYQIVILFKRTEKARAAISDKDPDMKMKLLMLDYIEEKLAIIYPDSL